jgi:hypothetical protein
MIREFLSFRYRGVRRIDEILAKPTDFGWRCRKYIKWRDVHNSKTDAKSLYSFADELIDNGRVKLDLYGQVSAIWLNVQKWRLDKEKLAIDPPTRKDWEKREILFKAAQTNPTLIPAQLSESGLETDGLSSFAVQILFYASELDAFFASQKIDRYPTKPVSQSLLPFEEEKVRKVLQDRFGHVYRSVGLKSPKAVSAAQLLCQIIEDLGFSKIVLNPNLLFPPREHRRSTDPIIEYVALEKFRLLEVATAAGVAQVRVNLNHPFIKSIAHNGRLDPKAELFIRSYVNSMLRMAGSIKAIETFNSYLGLELHNAIRLLAKNT